MLAHTAAGLRILALHGGGTNAAIGRAQTAKLRHTLKNKADFTFAEGTVSTEALDPAIKKRFEGPFFSWYGVTHDDTSGKPYGECLLDNAITFEYPHAYAAMDRLETIIEEDGPFDALLGFSQGAVLITMLTALRLKRAREGTAPAPTWKLNVLVCGMPIRANALARELQLDADGGKLEFPCLIAQGLQDPFYEWCQRVEEHYGSPSTLQYDDGHRFPHSRDDTQRLADAILLGCGHEIDASPSGTRGRAVPTGQVAFSGK